MQPLVPLLAHVIGPVTNLDSNPVGIEDEERVVAWEVRFLLRRAVDPGVHAQTALIGVVDFARIVDREGEVLDPYLEVVVFPAVGFPALEREYGGGHAPSRRGQFTRALVVARNGRHIIGKDTGQRRLVAGNVAQGARQFPHIALA